MREIAIGETKVRVRGTPLALLYYKQEFKTDLVGDLSKMGGIDSTKKGKKSEPAQLDPSRLDSVMMLQATWAMAKADAGLGAQFPSFMEWLAGLPELDMSDPLFLGAVMEEIIDGFFRGQRRGSGRRGK